MTEYGACFDPGHWDDPLSELKRFPQVGLLWQRSVHWPDRDYRDLFRGFHDLGGKNALVIAGESIGGREYRAVADECAERYDGLVDLVLVGNEADQQPGGNLDESFEQTAEDWNNLIWAYCDGWPGVKKAGPGASSGHPWRLQGFDYGKLDYLSGHPVGKLPNASTGVPAGFSTGWLSEWLDGYAALGRPLVIDEVVAPESELKAAQGPYLAAMLDQLNDPRVAVAMVYCWSDRMSPEKRMGLVRADGSAKPALATVSEQIRRLAPEVPTHEPEIGVSPMYTIDSETWTEINRLGWTPASDYVPEAGGGHVFCEEGIVYYLNGPARFASVPFA